MLRLSPRIAFRRHSSRCVEQWPVIGSVSHEPHTYGPQLIHQGLAILSGQRVPSHDYVEHKLVTVSSLRNGKTD